MALSHARTWTSWRKPLRLLALLRWIAVYNLKIKIWNIQAPKRKLEGDAEAEGEPKKKKKKKKKAAEAEEEASTETVSNLYTTFYILLLRFLQNK